LDEILYGRCQWGLLKNRTFRFPTIGNSNTGRTNFWGGIGTSATCDRVNIFRKTENLGKVIVW
jgi:hypothetical protein